jgi:hypothetical protein
MGMAKELEIPPANGVNRAQCCLTCIRNHIRELKLQISLPMAAFANDTNLVGNDNERIMTVDQLICQAQRSFTTWNELLHATGHFMELAKCSCYLLIWQFQEDGYAYTLTPEEKKTL